MATGRSDYEERKESRIDRLNNMAANASNEAQEYFDRSNKLSERFYMGQPIIVGHYSEKGARATQKRMHNAMEHSIEASEKAEYYAERAESAANNTAIFSDDPNAPDKLAEEIAKLEAEQVFMKAVNAYWRKHKTMKGFEGMSDENAVRIDLEMETAYSCVQKSGPYTAFRLSNNNGTIKRLKERQTQLQKLDEMGAEIIAFDGGEIEVDIEENRVKIHFKERQNDETTARLKSNGFKWSRRNGCWQRLRTSNALFAAKTICL